MLKELRIKNYAIIDELNVDFKPMLNILTGETGAGKSIIIESLGLILGERASEESIRSGEDSATVEAVFNVSKIKNIKEMLLESGIETEDDEVIIKRQISRSGKNRNYINGNVINLSGLKNIGNMLVDIHGQHEHQTLLHSENHCIVLDLYGDTAPIKEKFKNSFLKLQYLQREMDELINKEKERMQRINLLNFQKDEIDKTELKIGEDEELKKEKNLLQNAERLHQKATETYNILYLSDGSVIEKLKAVILNITEICKIDSHFEKVLENGSDTLFQIEEVASKIGGYIEKIEFNPNRLSEIDDRLSDIANLKRKYGAGIEDILKYRNVIDEELIPLSRSQERMDALTAEIESLKKDLERISIELAEKRENAAGRFESQVGKELKELRMDKVNFKVNFLYYSDDNSFVKYKGKPVRLFPEGIGKIEFYLSPNTGEDLKQLSKIASGGELSRVMLAIKNIITTKDSIPVLIFDEVDSGIGGAVAEVVGEKLKRISQNRQVFCITHLPQIAGFADAHFQVTKNTSGGRTVTLIKELTGSDRVEEIARMVGGKIVTETAREHAEELIKI